MAEPTIQLANRCQVAANELATAADDLITGQYSAEQYAELLSRLVEIIDCLRQSTSAVNSPAVVEGSTGPGERAAFSPPDFQLGPVLPP